MTSAPTVSKSFKIRESSFDDYPQISALETAYDLQPRSFDAWKHLWIKNVAFHRFRDHFNRPWPIGWVLTDGDRIVGSIGNVPLLYEFEGRTLFVAAGRSWVVDESFRGYSPFLLDLFFTQESVDLCLATSVNAQASKVYEELGAVRVPRGSWDQSLFWITNYKGFASSLLRSKNVLMPELLAYPVAAAAWLKNRSSGTSSVSSASTAAAVRRVSEFGPEFDVFWDMLRKQNSHCLLAIRTREALDWHFRDALEQKRLWLFTVSRGDQLIAYAILLRQDNPSYGLKRVRLVDFQALAGEGEYLALLLQLALQDCRADNVHMLEILGFSVEELARIKQLHPLQRQLPSWLYLYRSTNPKLAEKLTQPQIWCPSVFDGDLSL